MRLFIADADSTFRLALQMYLQQEPGVHVTGIASEAAGLSVQIEASQPDALLLDWSLPGASMQDMLSEIRELKSPPKIAVISVRPEDKGPALCAGADVFVSKNELPGELVKVVRSLRETKDPRSR